MTNSVIYGRPFWFAILVSFFFVLMLALGVWQLLRGFDKREELLQLAEPRPALTNEDLMNLDRAARFQPVRLLGYWTRHSYLLDNSIYKEMQPPRPASSPFCFLFSDCAALTGRSLVGYRVFTLFAPRDSRALFLVERGWLPATVRRTLLPSPAPLPSSALSLDGLFVPAAGKRRVLKKQVISPTAEVQLLQSVAVQQLARTLQREIHPIPIVLSRHSAGALERFAPLANFSYLSAQRHWGYAIQWFLMALALLCAYAFFYVRTRKE